MLLINYKKEIVMIVKKHELESKSFKEYKLKKIKKEQSQNNSAHLMN